MNFNQKHILAGTHVAKGNPTKIFTPFLSPRNLKASSENIKDRLLVNFDPLRCYIEDLQASKVTQDALIFHFFNCRFHCLLIFMKM